MYRPEPPYTFINIIVEHRIVPPALVFVRHWPRSFLCPCFRLSLAGFGPSWFDAVTMRPAVFAMGKGISGLTRHCDYETCLRLERYRPLGVIVAQSRYHSAVRHPHLVSRRAIEVDILVDAVSVTNGSQSR